MPGEHMSGCIVPGECRELPGECKVAGVKCYGKGNAKNARGTYERMQIARGMQGNTGECQGNVR